MKSRMFMRQACLCSRVEELFFSVARETTSWVGDVWMGREGTTLRWCWASSMWSAAKTFNTHTDASSTLEQRSSRLRLWKCSLSFHQDSTQETTKREKKQQRFCCDFTLNVSMALRSIFFFHFSLSVAEDEITVIFREFLIKLLAQCVPLTRKFASPTRD